MVPESCSPLVDSDYRTAPVANVMCLGGGGLVADSYCLHPAPWQEDTGQCIGMPRSHGCIRLSRAIARWLFEHRPCAVSPEIPAPARGAAAGHLLGCR